MTIHEFAHALQDAFVPGITSGAYTFPCPANGDCTSYGPTTTSQNGQTVLIDPPLMNPLCGCGHVQSASPWHCMQSIERTSSAQSEGFAHYLASKIWNRRDAPCVFNYYKEFLDETCRVESTADCHAFAGGGVVTPPPVPLDCGTPVKWRNRNECVVAPQYGNTKSDMGTEAAVGATRPPHNPRVAPRATDEGARESPGP